MVRPGYGGGPSTTTGAAYPEGPARSPDQVQAENMVRIVLRPIATPICLGFLGLAGATLPLSALQLRWVSSSQEPAVGLILMSFSAVLQLVAAIYGFLTRDSVAATGMGILSGTWFATGLVTYMNPSPLQTTSGGLAFLLFAAGTGLFIPIIAATQSKLLAGLVLLCASVRFFFTGAYELSGSATWRNVAGWTGIVLFGLAVVAALAFEMEDVKRKKIPLTMRRNRGAAALAGSVLDEVAGVQHEAGVREQL